MQHGRAGRAGWGFAGIVLANALLLGACGADHGRETEETSATTASEEQELAGEPSQGYPLPGVRQSGDSTSNPGGETSAAVDDAVFVPEQVKPPDPFDQGLIAID